MKRIQTCEFALVIITLLVLLASSNPNSSALITSTKTISSAGTIQITTATNYAIVPDKWDLTGMYGTAVWYLDLSVLHLGHVSIRSEKQGTLSRECLCLDLSNPDKTIHIKPGDHIVFKVWMKTGTSSIGDTSANAGIRLGIDFKDSVFGRITGIQSPDGAYWTPSGGYPSNQYLNFVKWNTDWSQRTMDFIIPSQYPADGLAGGYAAGTMHTPYAMIPWIQVWSDSNGNADTGLAWFADAELYINP
jgi:hypothetical protein